MAGGFILGPPALSRIDSNSMTTKNSPTLLGLFAGGTALLLSVCGKKEESRQNGESSHGENAIYYENAGPSSLWHLPFYLALAPMLRGFSTDSARKRTSTNAAPALPAGLS